jgi:hypothetical protein
VVVVVLLLRLRLLRRHDGELRDAVPEPFEGAQVVQGFRCHFSEHHVLEVEEGAGREGHQEAAVVGVLLADAAQQSGAVVRQFEGLVAEGWSEDGAVAVRQVSQLCVGSRHLVVEMVVNKREGASLEAGSAQQQSSEVFGSPGDGVLE